MAVINRERKELSGYAIREEEVPLTKKIKGKRVLFEDASGENNPEFVVLTGEEAEQKFRYNERVVLRRINYSLFGFRLFSREKLLKVEG